MSYARNRLLLLLLSMACECLAQEVPFFFPSLPVVYADPGFGIGYRSAGDNVEESHYGAYGKGRYGRVHGAFAYEYAELDSLYRRNYWNLSSSYLWTYFGLRGISRMDSFGRVLDQAPLRGGTIGALRGRCRRLGRGRLYG